MSPEEQAALERRALAQARQMQEQARAQGQTVTSAADPLPPRTGGIFTGLMDNIRLNNSRPTFTGATNDAWNPYYGEAGAPTIRRANRASTAAVPLSERELALANLYRGPASSRYLVHAGRDNKTILSPQAKVNARLQKKADAKTALLQRFRTGLPQHGLGPSNLTDDQLGVYITEARRLNSRNTRLSRASKPKKQMSDFERQLRQIHRVKPNVMFKPQYAPLLEQVRGINTADQVTNKQWLGRTPQTLDDEEYNSMVNSLGEMIGVAHMRPEFDRRLLHEASAKEVFGDEGYTYDLRDMDNDVNTPGTLFITRNTYQDVHGNTVPSRVVAIGGYRLPDATAGQTERLLKDMHYYGSNPTRDARKRNNRQSFMAKFPAIYPQKTHYTGFQAAVKFITYCLEHAGITTPVSSGSKFVSLAVTNDRGQISTRYGVYRLNTVLWNTVMSRAAKLFTYYVIVPEIIGGGKVPPPNASLALKALFDVGNKTLLTEAVRQVLGPQATPSKFNIEATIALSWQKYLIDPPLENAIFRDRQVQDYIMEVLNKLATPEHEQIIKDLVEVIIPSALASFMKLNLRGIVAMLPDNIVQAVDVKPGDTQQMIYQKMHANRIVLVLEKDARDAHVERLIESGGAVEHPMSAIRQNDIDSFVAGTGGYRGTRATQYYDPAYLNNPDNWIENVGPRGDYPDGGEFAGPHIDVRRPDGQIVVAPIDNLPRDSPFPPQ